MDYVEGNVGGWMEITDSDDGLIESYPPGFSRNIFFIFNLPPTGVWAIELYPDSAHSMYVVVNHAVAIRDGWPTAREETSWSRRKSLY